jgi:hypothetical protein
MDTNNSPASPGRKGWRYEGHPESKDRFAIKKNKQSKNKKFFNVSLLQTLSYFST